MEYTPRFLVILFASITISSTVPVNVVDESKIKDTIFVEIADYENCLLCNYSLVGSTKRQIGDNSRLETINEQIKDTSNTLKCGTSDTSSFIGARRKRRYVLQGSYWRKRKLSWRLINNNNDGLSRRQVLHTMRTAFSKFQDVANLQFYEKKSGNADIRISFVTGDHHDGKKFTGPRGAIAHAFYPYSNHGLSGDVHFNDDVYFTLGKSYGRNLLWVTLHELGHSLGLDHSKVRGAVMYPDEHPMYDLTKDDITGLQRIYGSSKGYRKRDLISKKEVPQLPVKIKEQAPNGHANKDIEVALTQKKTFLQITEIIEQAPPSLRNKG